MSGDTTAPQVAPVRHWINGEWIGSSTVAHSISPSTGEVLGHYSAGGRTEAAAAITAARKAFDASGVVNIFTEAGNEGAPLLVESPDVDVINCTGSTKVGR